ncbi:protein kinase domain-containing protein [Haloferula sp.]|uniref:protein kinase domain-containing protein n=1 Tax=Haloferula sp. TaxID=2497595 RepID=UPI003C71855C
MSDAPFEAPSIQSIAELFPAFDIDHLIAQGGMGAVYKARQRSLDRDVAIKILPREMGANPQFRTSFEAEAKAMAKVTHPNLITIYDHGDVEGLLFIVMEYVPGKSLYYSAHMKKVDPRQAVELVIGICRGIGQAHEHDIVHRDLKPANVLLTPKREPKIGDFGLAMAAGHQGEGLAMGTPGYIAPEVIQQPEHGDQRSDIFAIGVILRELLTGIPPETDPTAQTNISDSRLQEICAKASHADPAERYQSANSLAADLKSWLQLQEAPSENSSPKPSPVTDHSASHSLGRNLAIIVVLLAAIFGAWKLLERKKMATALAKEVAEEKAARAKAQKLPPIVVTPPKPTPPAFPIEPTEPVEPVAPEPPPVVDTQPTETPAQSLLRLRDKLNAGDFSELPVGTLTKDDSHYFFVTRATSWQSASRMARAFGGHLPLLTDDELRTWLAEAIPSDSTTTSEKQAAWIGASRTTPEQWQQVSGRPWPLGSPPTGTGKFAAIDIHGKIHARAKETNHPFFIQWHRDGSNPTRIRELLTASGASQQSGQPFFPPGIEDLGDRRFLVVEESHPYSTAVELAKLGGGKLMSAATAEEADWLEQRVKNLVAPDGLWLGANFTEPLWNWNDLQPWTFARWSPSSTPGSGDALLIKPKSGWAPAGQDSIASGFVIEWSDEAEPTPASIVDLDLLAARANDLLKGLDKTRRKAAAENSEEYLWKLDVWLRRRGNNTEITAWTPRVLKIKAAVKDDRLPADIPEKPDATYPEPLWEIARFYLNKQKVIDLRFITKAEAIRDSYVSRLKEEAQAAEDIGQREAALMISEKAAAAEDIEAWVESFGFTSG